MAKTAMAHARLTPEIKEKAEAILKELGISISAAYEMFYRQIIAHQGIPFDLRLPNGDKSRMSIYRDSRTQKNMILEKCEAFGRFNDWERQILEKPYSANCLAAVFELYDLMPDQAKQRPVNVKGIIKMREGLACLA